MAVRNFWIHTAVDGGTHPVATGPRNKDGGMRIGLSIRNKGRSEVALTIQCNAHNDGTLGIRIYDHKGDLVHVHETTR